MGNVCFPYLEIRVAFRPDQCEHAARVALQLSPPAGRMRTHITPSIYLAHLYNYNTSVLEAIER